MGLISRILGSGKNAETIIEKGVEFIDNAFYTDEEKARNKTKFIDFYIEYQKTTSGQNLARRILSITVVSSYLFFALFGIVVYKFDVSWSSIIFDFVKELSMVVGIIIAFYFGHGILRTYKNGKTK